MNLFQLLIVGLALVLGLFALRKAHSFLVSGSEPSTDSASAAVRDADETKVTKLRGLFSFVFGFIYAASSAAFLLRLITFKTFGAFVLLGQAVALLALSFLHRQYGQKIF